MIIIALAVLAAFVLGGIVLPTRWGVFGFIAAATGIFFAQVGLNISTGYGGSSIEDSLVQITYRAFAPVLLALAVPFIFRLSAEKRI